MVGGAASLLAVLVAARGGATCEAISAASALRVLPRALMNASAMAGFFIVAKETKTILARSALSCVSVSA